MVVITETLIQQTAQVVNVLCNLSLTFNALLVRLQQLYPATAWDDTLLTAVLAAGKQLGTFKFIGGFPGGPITGYSVNANGLLLNPFNNNFAGCPAFKTSACFGCPNSFCDT